MILIAPTAFKGTLTARQAAESMAEGAREALSRMRGSAPGIRTLPLADGGNGLLEALEAEAGGKAHGVRVAGPLGSSVSARYLHQDERVVVETAEACGLHLVPHPLLDPMRATSRGVGELLLAAARAAEDLPLVVGLGGSATVDAGAGMAQALGWSLLDDTGHPIPPGGAGLTRLAAVDPPAELPFAAPIVLADVENPLLGGNGAAAVYGPQKGANRSQVEQLERGLRRWADIVRRDLGRVVASLEGAGAAGGLGAAFAALFDAPPRPGAPWVLDAVGFDALLAEASVVVTGEGAWDEQSSMGKATGEVVRRAAVAGVPVLLVTGRAQAEPAEGVTLRSGDEEELDAAGVARLVAEALPGLLGQPGVR